MGDLEKRLIVDEEHLKLLRLGYLISAGINAVFSLFGLLYASMGCFLLFIPMPPRTPTANEMPPEFGWIFVVIGLSMTILMLSLAALKYRAARCLADRRGRTFCMVLAGVCCVGVPYGTLLSVFTFLVLGRPTVADLYRHVPPIHETGGQPEHGA